MWPFRLKNCRWANCISWTYMKHLLSLSLHFIKSIQFMHSHCLHHGQKTSADLPWRMRRWWCHIRSAWRSSGPGSTIWQRSWSYWSTSPWSHNAPYTNIRVVVRANPHWWSEDRAFQLSPKFERLRRHELQCVRGPVKVDDIELHCRVGLASLRVKQQKN